MRNTLTIARRELGSYFNSPIAYIVIAVFLLLDSFLFFNVLFVQNQADLRELFAGFWPTLLVAIFAPAITMRLIAEERQSGTLELLITMPVSDWQVVLGKFLGAIGMFSVAVVLMIVYGVTVAMLGHNLDVGPAVGGYLGLILMGAAFIAMGLMASAWTRSQIVAFIVALLLCLALWLVGKIVPFFPPRMQPIIEFLGVDSHIANTARGVIDTRDLVYYASLIGGCLLVAQQTLESRKWR
jgi:ABC-2 type transport system permease protein